MTLCDYYLYVYYKRMYCIQSQQSTCPYATSSQVLHPITAINMSVCHIVPSTASNHSNQHVRMPHRPKYCIQSQQSTCPYATSSQVLHPITAINMSVCHIVPSTAPNHSNQHVRMPHRPKYCIQSQQSTGPYATSSQVRQPITAINMSVCHIVPSTASNHSNQQVRMPHRPKYCTQSQQSTCPYATSSQVLHPITAINMSVCHIVPSTAPNHSNQQVRMPHRPKYANQSQQSTSFLSVSLYQVQLLI